MLGSVTSGTLPTASLHSQSLTMRQVLQHCRPSILAALSPHRERSVANVECARWPQQAFGYLTAGRKRSVISSRSDRAVHSDRVISSRSDRVVHSVRVISCRSGRVAHSVRVISCRSDRVAHSVCVISCRSDRVVHSVRVISCRSDQVVHSVRVITSHIIPQT